MPVTFNEDDLNQQQRVKCAFDPTQILSPGKVFSTAAPSSAACTSTAANCGPDVPRF